MSWKIQFYSQLRNSNLKLNRKYLPVSFYLIVIRRIRGDWLLNRLRMCWLRWVLKMISKIITWTCAKTMKKRKNYNYLLLKDAMLKACPRRESPARPKKDATDRQETPLAWTPPYVMTFKSLQWLTSISAPSTARKWTSHQLRKLMIKITMVFLRKLIASMRRSPLGCSLMLRLWCKLQNKSNRTWKISIMRRGWVSSPEKRATTLLIKHLVTLSRSPEWQLITAQSLRTPADSTKSILPLTRRLLLLRLTSRFRPPPQPRGLLWKWGQSLVPESVADFIHQIRINQLLRSPTLCPLPGRSWNRVVWKVQPMSILQPSFNPLHRWLSSPPRGD